MNQAAVGFRVKSGWAMVILLAGPLTTPKVIDRRRIELADPAVPESCYPYHAALELSKAEGTKAASRLVKIVERFAHRSVSDIIEHYRNGGYRLRGAGIVVGSTVDPVTIKNDHIRAHAEEGRLFRLVIETGAKRFGLKSSVTVEKELFERASQTLRIPETRLKTELTAFGRAVDGRWRAEEKAATLAAWMLLA